MHAAGLVGGVDAGGVGHPPQQGGRVRAASQEHLARDRQPRACGQRTRRHVRSSRTQGEPRSSRTRRSERDPPVSTNTSQLLS